MSRIAEAALARFAPAPAIEDWRLDWARNQAPISLRIVPVRPGIVAGLPWMARVLQAAGTEQASVRLIGPEGQRVAAAQPVAEIRIVPALIQPVVEPALDYLRLISALASRTGEFVKRLQGTGVAVQAGREALPGLVDATRYAIAIGGGQTDDPEAVAVLELLPAEIDALGSIEDSVTAARAARETPQAVYVRAGNLAEIEAALETGIDGLVLVNFASHELTRGVNMIAAHRRRFRRTLQIVAEGFYTPADARDAADAGPDIVRVATLGSRIEPAEFRIQRAD